MNDWNTETIAAHESGSACGRDSLSEHSGIVMSESEYDQGITCEDEEMWADYYEQEGWYDPHAMKNCFNHYTDFSDRNLFYDRHVAKV